MLTVGGILRREREKQQLTLEDIEKKIRVRRPLLEAIERDDWTPFSSKIYITGVIKNYAKVLDLPVDKVLAFFRREYAKKDVTGFQTKVPSKLLDSGSRRYLGYAIAGMVFLFVVYFGYQIYLFLSPPDVKIFSPKTHVYHHVDKIRITGLTDRESQVTIYGTRVYQNKDGYFSYDLPLKHGKNYLKVEVIGANGKKTVVQEIYTLQ